MDHSCDLAATSPPDSCFGPRPSAINDRDPIFPSGGNFWSDWKRFSASMESGPQIPFACPLKYPFAARACWISAYRSADGVCCLGGVDLRDRVADALFVVRVPDLAACPLFVPAAIFATGVPAFAGAVVFFAVEGVTFFFWGVDWVAV
jgi:hypothetical protein